MILTFFLGFSLIFISEYLKRRERDSNPRYLSVRRFSRPVHSTTLPSLHRVLDPIDIVLLYVTTRYVVLLICGCKGSSFYLICKTFRNFFLKNMKKEHKNMIRCLRF